MKIPFLNNLRRGFATNSSSSHSLIYFKKPVSPPHNSYNKVDVTNYENEFGWNRFELTTIPEKLFYVLVQLIGSQGYWDKGEDKQLKDAQKKYAKYGHLFPEFDETAFYEALGCSIDHQSQRDMSDPKNFIDLARDPHIGIYGGNDNGDNDILEEYIEEAEWGMEISRGRKIYTKDIK